MKVTNRSWLTVLGVIACIACGDDNSDAQHDEHMHDAGAHSEHDAGSSGGGGKAGATSGTAGSSTGTMSNASLGAAVMSAKCGSKTCTAQGGFASACCVDEETETCGMAFMGGACAAPEPGDERCPSVMGFATLPSCCTADGMCGINAAMFGMPGCIELGAAAARAQMTSASAFPKPRACDGSTSADSDAGTDADGGM